MKKYQTQMLSTKRRSCSLTFKSMTSRNSSLYNASPRIYGVSSASGETKRRHHLPRTIKLVFSPTIGSVASKGRNLVDKKGANEIFWERIKHLTESWNYGVESLSKEKIINSKDLDIIQLATISGSRRPHQIWRENGAFFSRSIQST